MIIRIQIRIRTVAITNIVIIIAHRRRITHTLHLQLGLLVPHVEVEEVEHTATIAGHTIVTEYLRLGIYTIIKIITLDINPMGFINIIRLTQMIRMIRI